MAFRYVAVVAALACINFAAGHHHKAPIIEECPTPVIEVPVPVPVPVVEACPAPIVEACPQPIIEACPQPIIEACPKPIAPVCPAPALPAIEPIVIQSVIPAPFTIGPQAPGVIEHVAHPYEINYFAKPWILKHAKSAALNIFTQHPVVVDEYAAPSVHEQQAPAAVIVEEVCGVAPAPCAAPAPCC